ncbi:RNA-binding protein 48 [Phytophthora nicotianae]|uniref:RNA-binding protein 48 n=1 Tax=Phytophthora nicotianae TaxID=4792 RepID=A0A0W8D4X0_PHYNI|nr:RNA-binding protein 48 [Phytophthora nicotianae]
MARSQAIDALHGRYRYHRSIDEELQAVQTLSDEDPPDGEAARNQATVEMGLRSGAGSHTIQVTVGGQQRIAEAMCDQPLQAQVELSLDPGGDKFKPGFDYSQAPQWMLACITLLAVAGLINTIWAAAAIEGDSTADIDKNTKPPTVDKKEFNADRGCVLDSGTTFLYMPESTKQPFRLAWSRAVGSFSFVPESDTFYFMTSEQVAALPDVCFWFKNDVHICLPSTRYFAQVGNGIYTGTIFFTAGPKATILGASVLEGHDVIYDVDNHRVGIAEAMCDQPLQAQVELSLDPGGDKFKPGFDYSQAPQWMLACITLLAVAGLINTIWAAAAIEGDSTADIDKNTKPPTVRISNDWQDEEFSFFLMEENAPK